MNEKLPKTVDEAAEFIISVITDTEKHIIRNVPFCDVVLFHHSLGTLIRNKCELWNNANGELLAACGGESIHPDTASTVIMRKVWQKLNSYSDEQIEKLLSPSVLQEALDILENHPDQKS